MAMSWQIAAPNDSVNMILTTGASAMFKFKSLLLANGGVIRASSDGTANFGTADYISQAGSGANGLNNNYAYFVITLGAVDFAFQRGTDGRNWRGKISIPGFQVSTAGYVAGTLTAMPIVTDQQHLCGTDGPTFQSGLWAADGTAFRVSMGIDNASPHHFWVINQTTRLVFDSLSGASGSDLWPYVVAFDGYGTVWATSNLGTTTYGLWSYYRRGNAAEAFVRWPAMTFSNNTSDVGVVGYNGPDPDNGFDRTMPMFFIRKSSLGSPGKKGFASNIRWACQNRQNPDYFDDASGQRWTVVQNASFKSPSGVVLMSDQN
jgi:hypothetical protein